MIPVIKSSQISEQTRPLRVPVIVAGSAVAKSQPEHESVLRKASERQARQGEGRDQKVAHDDSWSVAQASQRPCDDTLSSAPSSAGADPHAASAAVSSGASAAADGVAADGEEEAIIEACRTAHEEGMQQGWNAGYEQGMREGLLQGREESAARQSYSEQLAAVAEAIGLASRNWQAELETAAIEIGYAALLRIVGQKAGERDLVESAVRAVLEQLPGRRLLSIHLAPEDHALLHAGDELPPSLGAVLLADERVSMGGCIVETDAGSLDGRLETRLAELKALLLEVRHAQEIPR